VFNVGKSKAKLVEKGEGTRVTFKDVAGQASAKQEVQEIVEFLKNPGKFTELGGKIPKGALLVGPPGTGKTLLAKAVAGEADVPFFSMSGSDFVEMFVGVGASRVRDLFRQAKEKSPCIIFIDEIDAVGRARGKNPAMGGNDERENTLNQLLTEMDGFGTNSGVIILAATNRVDILDKALLRAGRFDRQIHVDLPDLNERKEVFQVHLKPVKIDDTVDIDLLARQTPGFSGADIANVCNEAALIAARHNKKSVSKDDFLSAVDRIIGGLEKKTKVMTNDEKRTIALHEAGHATISWFLQYANPLIKVTIVPRGRALGAAWYLPEERQITTKEQMLDEMCATLGGRAAEEVFVGHISSGALNDLERVTKQAYGMIAYMGMSDRLPNLCYYSNDEYSFSKPYSDKTAQLIDEEVKNMIAEQYERAKNLLLEHKEGHAQLAQLLVEKEVIFAEDVEKIFGKRPWTSRTEELLTLNAEQEQQEAAKASESDSPATETAEEPKALPADTAEPAVSETPKTDNGTEAESTENKDNQ
jgi:ATP-dependent metalloprotease FtsH